MNPFDEIAGSDAGSLAEHGIRTARVAVAMARVLEVSDAVIDDIA